MKRKTILTLLTLFSSALISIIMPMSKELALALGLVSEARVSFINSMFLLVGAGCSIIWAILGDKFSRKNLLIIGTLIWSVFTLLTILSFNFYSLLLFQLFAAIGFGSTLPLIFSLLVDIVKIEKRGKAFGSLSATYVLGNGLGHILSGFLIDYYPWIIPFIIVSIGGFVCISFLSIMKEPLKGEMEKKSGEADVLKLRYKIKIKDFKEIWRTRTIALILVFNFAMFIAIGAVSSNFIAMLKNDYGISSTIATVVLIVIFGSQMISGPVVGNWADNKYKYEKDKNGRIKIILVCLFFGSMAYIIGFSLIFTITNLPMTIVFFILLLVGAFFFGGIDPLTQATLGDISPPQIRSTIYSLNFLVYSIGRALSVLLLSFFYVGFNNYYRPGYLILAILAMACTLFLIQILRTLPRDLEAIKSKKSENN